MNTFTLFPKALICATFLLLSCKEEVDLTPKESLICAPVGLAENHPHNKDYQDILDNYLSSGFPGFSAAIYTTNEGLWTGASGLADIGQGLAMSPCHVLFSGSVAKVYTVTAAMVLYEQGKLDLDAPIAPYLPPEVAKNLPNADKATIRQLMNHSAGMPDHDEDKELNKYLDKNDQRLPSAEEQLAFLYDDEARFEPGTSAAYSSAHTLALSLVIDHLAGEHHSQVISREIIQKLNLKETYYKNEGSPSNLIRGYVGKAQKNEDITKEAINYAESSQGDAGIMATAHDYYLFMKGLIEGKIVSQATLDEMMEAVYIFDQNGFALGFGLGLFIIKKEGETIKIGHGGMTIGGMAHLYYYPTTGSYIALTTNTITADNASMLRSWGAGILVGTDESSIMDDLERLILE